MTKRIAASVLALAMVILAAGCGRKQEGAQSAEPAENKESTESTDSTEAADMNIVISHQPQNHGLPSYIAEQEGYFEKNGLNAEILYFTAGTAQSEALGADEWDVGVMGVPPAASSGLAYDAKIIGLAAEDTMACNYWVRSDSEIAGISGKVEGHPEILGDADSWRGKTILCPTGTSAHYLLIATLNLLGLTEDDVEIVHMDVPSAFAAFKAGQGDICALWDPQSKQAAKEDWVMASNGTWTGTKVYNVIVASKKAIEEKPDAVLAWLKTYYEVCDDYNDNKEGQVDYLLELQLDNGLDVDKEIVTAIVNERPMPTTAEQKELWAGEPGSRPVDSIVYDMFDYFVDSGKYTEEDKEYLQSINFIDDTFIKQLFAD